MEQPRQDSQRQRASAHCGKRRSAGCPISSSRPEEVLQKCGGGLGQNARGHLGPVIQPRILQEVPQRPGHPRLRDRRPHTPPGAPGPGRWRRSKGNRAPACSRGWFPPAANRPGERRPFEWPRPRRGPWGRRSVMVRLWPSARRLPPSTTTAPTGTSPRSRPGGPVPGPGPSRGRLRGGACSRRVASGRTKALG